MTRKSEKLHNRLWHSACALLDLVYGDLLLWSSKVVVFCQEEHAVALLHESTAVEHVQVCSQQHVCLLGMLSHLPLSHWCARTVPVSHFRFGSFVIIVPARAQGHTKRLLVLCKPLDNDGRYRFVHAKVSATALCVLLRKLAHNLQILVFCLSRD